MTNQPRDIPTVLKERLLLVQAIAAANCEHMRLTQIASGLMILDQKDEDEEGDPRSAERAANTDAVDLCVSRIEALERQMAKLDDELANAPERNQK